MRKITVFVIIISILITALCACSGKPSSSKDGFYSPSVIAELFCAYPDSVMKNIIKPSSGSYAESLAEYTYMTEDGPQTAHTPVSSYLRSDGAISVTVGEHSTVFGDGLAVDGYDLTDITDKKTIQKVFDIFIKAFCRNTENGDFETAPDSIRASDEDVEVSRVTLKLEKERYVPAFEAALDAVRSDGEAKSLITDILGLYGFLHNREENAQELFDDVFSALSDAVKNSDGQLVWQRYVKDGKTVAARLKFGDNVIRYIFAETSSYTELEMSAEIGGAGITLGYEARRTGMSDTYNIRISNGTEITYFDGTAESAYKSGNINFELRATKNANVVNGLKTDMSFNGEKTLTYKGNGSIVRNGDKKTFDFELTFDGTKNAGTEPAHNGDIDCYQALTRVFG